MLNETVRLKNAGVDAPETVFDVLCAHILGISYGEAKTKRLSGLLTLSDENKFTLETLITRRISGEPLQYITGDCEFYGRTFICAENVLIPRPETEILVGSALGLLPDNASVLDLCSGTGCIGISLAIEKNASVTLADISPHALACSQKNSEKLGVADKIKTIRHDVLSPDEKPEYIYDMITSNPPYIESGEMGFLQPEVKKEPALALDGGADGLKFYRAIVSKYKNNLKKGGYIVFECGWNQAKAVSRIFCENGFINIKIIKDYNNTERVVSAQFFNQERN